VRRTIVNVEAEQVVEADPPTQDIAVYLVSTRMTFLPPPPPLAPLLRSVLFIVALATLNATAAPGTVQPLIRINQIGYLPDGDKVAVIADPQVGPDAALSFTPGDTYAVRRWGDDTTVFTGAPTVWNGGATHAQSGDRGWWFDFSAVTEEGSYYLWDEANGVRSHRFEIAATVYDEVLRLATRMYFYQRLGFAQEAPFAGEWTDPPAFLGPGQDTEARSAFDRNNPDTARDLRGGWMDAGDVNKYVTFAEGPIHQLLHAWEERPEAFGDANNIPESGNGLPDLLDEVHFELQWLARMQEPDGGVLLKMGEIDYNGTSPPSADTRPRYYVPTCSSSTIAAAGMYAHAALVFRQIPRWQAFAAELEQRAIDAWNHYHANPRSTDCDDGTVKSGDADRSLQDQDRSAVTAATYLHRLTAEADYAAYVENHYIALNPFSWGGFSVYQAFLAEALLHYMNFPDAPASVVATIRQRKLNNENGGVINWTTEDLYRAYMPDGQYHWGSSFVRANFGNASLDYAAFGLSSADLPERRLRAENLLHSFLGLNPLGLVYLSRMEDYGAENSIQEIYHTWFVDGTPWDTNPPPGYVVGGPNKDYDGSIASLQGLPPQKSYLDFNDGWPENSWELSEPAIYYQAAFIKMLSKFVSPQLATPDTADSDGDGLADGLERWLGIGPGTDVDLVERLDLDTSGATPELIIHRALAVDPFEAIPEWSADLATWTPLPPEQSNLRASGEDSLTLAYALPAGADDGAIFVRFRLADRVTDTFQLE